MYVKLFLMLFAVVHCAHVIHHDGSSGGRSIQSYSNLDSLKEADSRSDVNTLPSSDVSHVQQMDNESGFFFTGCRVELIKMNYHFMNGVKGKLGRQMPDGRWELDIDGEQYMKKPTRDRCHELYYQCLVEERNLKPLPSRLRFTTLFYKTNICIHN